MRLSYEKAGSLISDISLTHHIENSFNDISEKFNLKSNLIKSKNRNLQSLVNKSHIPFVCPIYIKNLTYHPLYKINKWDLSHFITILDIGSKNATVSDCYIPIINDGEIFEGKVKLKELQSAWRKDGCWYYEATDVIPFVSSFQIDTSFCKSIFHKNMDFFIGESLKNELNFVNDFSLYLKDYTIKDIKKNLNNIALKIRISGLLDSRQYLKEFLIYHLNYENAEILNFIDKNRQNWREICNLIYKATLLCSQSCFDSIKNMGLDIINEEFKIFSKLMIL